jgi:hypothetical protein
MSFILLGVVKRLHTPSSKLGPVVWAVCLPKDTCERSNLQCMEICNYKDNRLRSRGGWSGMNAVGFCLGGARTESRPGHCLTGLRFSGFSPPHTANVCNRPPPHPSNTFPIYLSPVQSFDYMWWERRKPAEKMLCGFLLSCFNYTTFGHGSRQKKSRICGALSSCPRTILRSHRNYFVVLVSSVWRLGVVYIPAMHLKTEQEEIQRGLNCVWVTGESVML